MVLNQIKGVSWTLDRKGMQGPNWPNLGHIWTLFDLILPKKIFTGPNITLRKFVGLVLRVALPKKWVIGPVNPWKMSNFWVLFRPNNSIFWKVTYKSNLSHLLNILFDLVKKNFMAKFGQIVAKYDPNLAKFGLTDLSYPWNSLIFIQNPSNGIKRTFLYAEFLRIPYGPSEWRVRSRLHCVNLQLLQNLWYTQSKV